MDLNKYLNETAAPETQYSKEEYAAMKKAEREEVWVQVDARMGEVLADAPALQEFLNFMSQSRNSLPNQLLLSGQNADITDARTFQQWKDKVAWKTLQSDLFANLPQIKAERMPQDFSVVLPKLWRKRQAWDAERTKRPPYRGEER